MLNIHLLMMFCIFNLSIMVLINSALWYVHPNIKNRKYFTYFGICFLFGQYLITFVNILPDYLTLVLGNNLMILGEIFLLMAIKSFLGKSVNRDKRYYLFLLTKILLFYVFAYLFDSIFIRLGIFSIISAVFLSSIAWLFFQEKSVKNRFINNISAFIFFLGAVLFLIRTFAIPSINLPLNFLDTTNLLILLSYLYLSFLSIWIIVLTTIKK